MENKKIFVGIPSFIDKEIRETILDCYFKAKNGDNLVFGILLQYDDNFDTKSNILDDLSSFINIKVEKVHFSKSKGGSWARHQVQKLYSGEKYHLQIDAHYRFIKNWDSLLLHEYSELKKDYKKPIISFIGPPYHRNDELGIDFKFDYIDSLDMLNFPKIKYISDEYWVDFQGYTNVKSTNNINNQIPLLYCGFIFTEDNWINEIPADPKHYYTGEEFALSIRSYTHGYNIFLPTQILAWHRSNGNHIHHHDISKKSFKYHKTAVERLKKLINYEDLGKYGLGTDRQLSEYEQFAKINIKEKKCID